MNLAMEWKDFKEKVYAVEKNQISFIDDSRTMIKFSVLISELLFSTILC